MNAPRHNAGRLLSRGQSAELQKQADSVVARLEGRVFAGVDPTRSVAFVYEPDECVILRNETAVELLSDLGLEEMLFDLFERRASLRSSLAVVVVIDGWAQLAFVETQDVGREQTCS